MKRYRLSFACLLLVAAMGQAARGQEQKPTLWFVVADWCDSCAIPKADLQDAEFRAALESKYRFVPDVDYDQWREWAQWRGVRTLPAFVTSDGKVLAYRGKQALLESLGIGRAQLPQTFGRPASGAQCGCAAEFARLNARIAQLEAQLAAIAVKSGSDGVDGAAGPRGPPGEKGSDGAAGKDGRHGRGIEGVSLNADGELLVRFTDGTLQHVGAVQGPRGPAGPPGTVTVLIKSEDGTELFRVENLTPGAEVDVPIRRTKTETQSGG